LTSSNEGRRRKGKTMSARFKEIIEPPKLQGISVEDRDKIRKKSTTYHGVLPSVRGPR